MRDDLLGAQAAVDWAVSKLPSFEKRLSGWTNRNINIVLKDTDPPGSDHLVIAKEKYFLPLQFSVEAGAYLNAIRSSLDVLASTLSARNGKTGNVEAHFPIFRSDLHALDPLCGLECIKWLSKSQRSVIKSLEPYPGGNDSLCALHKLDIMRKHRRLLETKITPAHITFTGILPQHVVFPAKIGIGANGETLLAFLSKDATAGKIQASFYVAFSEAGHYGDMPVIGALRDFAQTAANIIALFDAL